MKKLIYRWEMSKAYKFYDVIIKQFPYFIWRMKRILLLKDERAIVERAKLKSELGLQWTESERKAMKKALDRTIVKYK
jgi:hypothetical protein